MDLDSLSQQIAATSDESVVQGLSKLLRDWKSDERNVEQLRESVERYIGNTWIEKTKDHEHIYRLWSAFRDNAILPIGGMTMNERLFTFGLLDAWDAASEESRVILRRKVETT